MKKLFGLLALLAVTLLLTSTATSADSTDISGTGTLAARGVGRAVVSGDGTVNIRGSGVGVIHVSGFDSLNANGAGKRIDNPDGSVTLIGWRGEVHTSGSALQVTITGGKIEFKASGTGEATLHGKGNYRVCHEGESCSTGGWIDGGVTVKF